jgi:hypothetical protein
LCHHSGVSASKPTIEPDQLHCYGRLRKLLPMLASLRDVGCQRDAAGNRELHFDEYVSLVLLCLFNPLLDSMRSLQRACDLEEVAKRLGVRRFSLGSFSESVRCFDPARLRAVIAQLAGQVNVVEHDPALAEFTQMLTAVDGSLVHGLSTLASAWSAKFAGQSDPNAWRLHAHFDVLHGVPTEIEVTAARNGGKTDEKNVLRRRLEPDHCYIMDRWYGQFKLFNDIRAAGSSYVCRVKENSVFEVVEERLLDDAALNADIVRDALVRMGQSSKPADRPDHLIRLVIVEATPHAKRGGRKGKTAGPANKGLIVIATDLLELPAELVALIYNYRYTVEIFFRFLKQLLGCRHLLSTKAEGIQIQMLCALLACLLINLWTKAKPSKATVELLAWYFLGLASEQELERHIAKLKKPTR